MNIVMRVTQFDTGVLIIDLPVLSMDYRVSLNETGEWSAESARNYPGVTDIVEGQRVEVIDGKTTIFKARINTITPKKDTIVFQGFELLDLLYEAPNYPVSYYEDKPLIGVLAELLLQANWELGDISTLEDPEQLITLDLRGERTLVKQIKEVVRGIPNTFYRQGGDNVLDVGNFNRVSLFQALEHPVKNTLESEDARTYWVIDLQDEKSDINVIYGFRALGGSVKLGADEERVITLGDALTNQPEALFAEDFPIREITAVQDYIVCNFEDFPNPGGSLYSYAATEQAVKVGGDAGTPNIVIFSFVPLPGKLSQIVVWSVANNFFSDDSEEDILIAQLVEMDKDNPLIVANETPLAERTIGYGVNLPADGAIILDFSSENVVLSKDKRYGIRFYVDGLTSVNRSFDLAGSADGDTSLSFKSMFRTDMLASTYTEGVRPVMEVRSERIGNFVAALPTETNSIYKPAEDGANATSAAIAAAGDALYTYAKAVMRDRKPDQRSFSLKATGTPSVPAVGDTMRIQATTRKRYYDTFRGVFFEGASDFVNEFLRIDNYTLSMKDNQYAVSISLREGTGIPEADLAVELYEQVEKAEPPKGSVFLPRYKMTVDKIEGTISQQLPNTTNSLGRYAYKKTFSIFDGQFASVPAGYAQVLFAGKPFAVGSNGNLCYIELDAPDLSFNGSGTFDISFGFELRDWQLGDTINYTIYLLWR